MFSGCISIKNLSHCFFAKDHFQCAAQGDASECAKPGHQQNQAPYKQAQHIYQNHSQIHEYVPRSNAYQLPSAVSASPHVQGPQRPVAGTIGDAPQTAHLPVQSGSVSGSGLRRGRGSWGGFFMPLFYG